MTAFPKYFSRKAVGCYILAVIAVLLVFHRAAMPWYLYLFGLISVPVFFFGASSLTVNWASLSVKGFERKVFWTAFIIRLVYVVFIYFFNMKVYGTFYESSVGDTTGYIETAEDGLLCMVSGVNPIPVWQSWGIQISDLGYPIYLMIVYLLTFHCSTVIIPLILKAAFGAWTCVLIYRLAYRHFGEGVGRMASIFCILQFNMIWWCGSMMKETELIFLTVAFAEAADKMIVEKKYSIPSIALVAALIVALYFFRVAMAAVALLSLILTGILASKRVVGHYRSVFIGLTVIGLLILPGRALIQSSLETEDADIAAWKESQQTNMNWRAEREGGNNLAKYAGASVFAPLIFTIPFPSMVYSQQDQEMLMMVGGGNFTKNVMSFFVILTMFLMLFSGEWRTHLLPVAITCGYLFALVVSVYAQSGRFHMPVIPFEMMFAAWGVTQINKKSRLNLFNVFLAFEFIACIAWSWFKLKGRGM